MLLAINVNNTNVKFGVVDGDRIVGEWRAAHLGHAHRRRARGLAVPAHGDGEHRSQGRSPTRSSAASCRRPPSTFAACARGISTASRSCWANRTSSTASRSRAREPAPTASATPSAQASCFPRRRWSWSISALPPTFDVVDEEGSYCGGAIAPGINLSIEALVNATAQLPRIVVERPKQVIGTDTVACMHTGVFWGYVGLIEGIVARIKAEVRQADAGDFDRRPRPRYSTVQPR